MLLNMRHSNDMAKKTMCHEMVHIKQMAFGQLKTVEILMNNEILTMDLWNGKLTDGDYETLPWEIEAYQTVKLNYLQNY